MKFYQYLLSKLSKKGGNPKQMPTKATTLEHTPLNRTNDEIEQLLEWEQSQHADHFYKWLSNTYKKSDYNPALSNGTIDFISYPSIKGFIYHFNKEEHRKKDFELIFDSLSYRVKNLSYNLHQADTKKILKKERIVHKHRYYLKPSYKGINWEEKIPQKFGNITLELVEALDNPQYLKFSASIYNDRHYKNALGFDDLIRAIANQ